MATHSSVLAWRIPGMAEPGGLPSMGSHRVGHDWSDLAAAAAAVKPYRKVNETKSNFLTLIVLKKFYVYNKIDWKVQYFPVPCLHIWMCVHAKSLQSCLNLCNLMDCSLSRSFVHSILQARILECWSGLPCAPPGDLPDPGIESGSPALQIDSLSCEPLGEPQNS